ncbi:hypothetical protein PCANC_11999 [Puccinia coronata f. sp. avenae]|uniref:HAT C-terminal dimerisation domain-containing protein n=1 Tax=Puccinia coronata f. sp. avenae TaxID=200324 RepID=A0A2N5SX30_9BASI|nr:hypothetical protein PCANC_11999 [Puccinia coronata f. sp. avenae]
MATEVDRLMAKKTGGLVQTQTETLGYIPDLAPILDESKEIKEAAHFTAEDVIVGSSHDKRPTNREETLDVDVNDHSDAWETPKEGRNAVDTILKKDHVLSSQTLEYNTWSKKLDINGPASLLGMGYAGTSSLKGGTGGIKDEFYYITKKMEGDHSSACLMISEYRKIIALLRRKLSTSAEPEFKTMLQTMLDKTQTYLNEAMSCDAILIATILNPSFCLSIFQVSFPDLYDYTFALIKDTYEAKEIKFKEASSTRLLEKLDTPAGRKSSNAADQEEVDYFPEAVVAPVVDELAIYLGGKHKLPTSQASSCLEWWREQANKFPMLALLAKDYFGVLGHLCKR